MSDITITNIANISLNELFISNIISWRSFEKYYKYTKINWYNTIKRISINDIAYRASKNLYSINDSLYDIYKALNDIKEILTYQQSAGNLKPIIKKYRKVIRSDIESNILKANNLFNLIKDFFKSNENLYNIKNISKITDVQKLIIQLQDIIRQIIIDYKIIAYKYILNDYKKKIEDLNYRKIDPSIKNPYVPYFDNIMNEIENILDKYKSLKEDPSIKKFYDNIIKIINDTKFLEIVYKQKDKLKEYDKEYIKFLGGAINIKDMINEINRIIKRNRPYLKEYKLAVAFFNTIEQEINKFQLSQSAGKARKIKN